MMNHPSLRPNYERRGTVGVVGASLLADIVSYLVSISVVAELHPSLGPNPLVHTPHEVQHYVTLMLLVLPLWLATYVIRGLYTLEVMQHGTGLIMTAVNASAMATLLSLGAIYLNGEGLIPRGWLVITWATMCSLTVVGRGVVLFVARRYRRHLPWQVVIAGAGQTGIAAAQSLEARTDMRVLGFVDDYLPLGIEVVRGVRVLGRSTSVQQLAATSRIDELLVVDGALPRESHERLLRDAYINPSFPPLRLIPSTSGELMGRLNVARRGRVPLLVPELSRVSGPNLVVKNGFDRAIALLVIVVASPLFLLAWLWSVWAHQPFLRGTAFVGHRGRTIQRWSLAAWWAADDTVDATFRFSQERGMAGVVRLIRKLPRAFNVLNGELSLVGPRPIAEEDLTLYSEWVGVLLAIMPGLVGPWLLHSESTLTPEEELEADLDYVREHSLPRDLMILAGACVQLFFRLEAGQLRRWRLFRVSVLTGPTQRAVPHGPSNKNDRSTFA